MLLRHFFFGRTVILALFSLFISTACSVEASRTSPQSGSAVVEPATSLKAAAPKGPTIDIKPNSPADTVRAFYDHLREKRYREALYLTNLRPAIEGLTDTELTEFQVDFEAIGKHVPQKIEINGEVISGDSASVTARLPNKDLEENEVQSIELRRDKEFWIILTVDEKAEKLVRKEGNNYFRALRIETHQDEAREMLDRISKAQMAYAAQHKGLYGDLNVLVEDGLLPEDVRSNRSTGYDYVLMLTPDKAKYSVSATPAVYGKTGKLSFAVNFDARNNPRLTSGDNGGRPLAK